MAAVVSLAISLAIVPRQVMPWTGLLLMYEWTFALFFLLFGGYLHLIYKWGKRVATQAASRVESLDYDSGKGLPTIDRFIGHCHAKLSTNHLSSVWSLVDDSF